MKVESIDATANLFFLVGSLGRRQGQPPMPSAIESVDVS